MRIPRIYLPVTLAVETTLSLDKAVANHVCRVLRMKAGDPLIIFNGEGGEYMATLQQAEKNSATISIDTYIARDPESPLPLILAQGISRGDRMDFTIQKSVELGITEIIPLFTEFSAVQLKGERLEKKQQHWQAVAISACEQSGRTHVPLVHAPIKLLSWLDTRPAQGSGLILDPEATHSIGNISRPESPIYLLVGPEGGLSTDEIGQARERGFNGIRLGPRILRTETAALAACAAIQALWGDYR